ncbi:hypothetical protein AOLI_G00232610 [Acnodon oligacanthus]
MPLNRLSTLNSEHRSHNLRFSHSGAPVLTAARGTCLFPQLGPSLNRGRRGVRAVPDSPTPDSPASNRPVPSLKPGGGPVLSPTPRLPHPLLPDSPTPQPSNRPVFVYISLHMNCCGSLFVPVLH